MSNYDKNEMIDEIRMLIDGEIGASDILLEFRNTYKFEDTDKNKALRFIVKRYSEVKNISPYEILNVCGERDIEPLVDYFLSKRLEKVFVEFEQIRPTKFFIKVEVSANYILLKQVSQKMNWFDNKEEMKDFIDALKKEGFFISKDVRGDYVLCKNKKTFFGNADKNETIAKIILYKNPYHNDKKEYLDKTEYEEALKNMGCVG